MKKLPIIIAVSLLVAVGAFAEYNIFIKKHKTNSVQVALEETTQQKNAGQKDKPIIVSDAGGLQYFYEGISASGKDYQKIGADLLAVLDKTEKMSQCTITKNVDIVKKSGETEYYKVSDRTFGSLSDISKYFTTSISSSLLKERYSGITDGDSPVFMEFEDGLYVKRRNDQAKGFEWERDSNKNIILAVIEKSDDKFTVASTGYEIEIINEEGLWKVNSVNELQ